MSSKIISSLISCNRSELTNLFDEEHKPQLSNNINSLKEEHPTDPIIGLLWCYCQAEEKTIPISFIAGTIAEKFATPEIFNNCPDLCFIVFIKVAELLQNEDEHRLTLLILEPLYKSLGIISSKVTESDIETLKSLISSSVQIERKEAPKRKESKSYLQYLNDLESSLNHISIGDPSPPISEKHLSTESLLSEPISDLMESSSRKKSSPPPTDRQFKGKYWLIAATLVFIALMFIFKDSYYKSVESKILKLFSSRMEGTLYSLNTNSDIIEPYLPTLPPYSTVEKDSHLDSISERLSNIQTEELSNSSPSPEIIATKQKTPEIDKEEIESLNVIPESNEQIPIKKIPSLALSQVPVPIDLGNSNKGAPVEDTSPVMKADGRTYGKVSAQDPVAGKSNERALDGSPLKSYEVEKFDPPELYFTITATNVLAAPSLMAQSVARIEPKTTVRVTSIMGQWAEIRSNAGRLGYVFFKDLEKEDKSLD